MYTSIAPGAHTFTVTATSGTLSQSAFYTWSVGGVAANVWIDPAGSNSGVACARSASKIGEPNASTVCATPQQACQLAHGGDVIGVAAGTYTIGFNLNGCNPASNVTFENAPGAFVAFASASTITNASNIVLQGDQVGHGVGFSLSYTNITGSGGAVSNVTLNNINIYCQAAAPWNVIKSGLDGEVACNASMQFVGKINNVTWNGGDESDWATCLTSCTHSQAQLPIHNTIEPGPTNVTIENITISHYFDLDNNGSSGDHSEAWMIRGGSGILFLDNRFIDCSPPPATGYPLNNSCNSAYVFFGESGASNTTDNVTFTQNIIAPGYSGLSAFQWAYDVLPNPEYHLTLLYNTFDGGDVICGAGTNNKCGPGLGSTVTGSNILMVGNAMLLGPSGTCFSTGAYSHNVWFFPSGNAAHCSATDATYNSTQRSSLWASPQSPNFNYTPLATLQGKGENAYCPATDINGKARPVSAPCDAGALQH
jgi:hypothetical protein